MSDGGAVGAVGARAGDSVGEPVGARVVTHVGVSAVGTAVGTLAGSKDGVAVRASVGNSVRAADGVYEGRSVVEGTSELGVTDGEVLGSNVGSAVGIALGVTVGVGVGDADGTSVGLAEGAYDGVSCTPARTISRRPPAPRSHCTPTLLAVHRAAHAEATQAVGDARSAACASVQLRSHTTRTRTSRPAALHASSRSLRCARTVVVGESVVGCSVGVIDG